MTPAYSVNLQQLRQSANAFDRGMLNFERQLANMNKRFRDVRNNERIVVSRNKREGWYSAKHCRRTHDKLWALRYRRQIGAQLMRVKERK